MRYPLHLTIFIFCNYLQSSDFSVCKVNHFFLKCCNSQLFLYFCNIIFLIGVPDSRGMLYYEQSRIIKTRKMMKRTTSLFLFHLPYRHNLNPYAVSFEGLPLGESDDFSLFAACNGGGSYQASYIEDALFWNSLL